MISLESNRRHTRRAAGWLAVAAVVPVLASATEGEQVISGEATFTRDGSLLKIDTTTPQTIINWSGGFDIAPGATVRINQPNSLSNTLNYDLTTDPSRIEGSLFSNGGVWIINPVGVFFGDQAIVDVGRLVAGGGKIDAGDFLAGTQRFTDLTGKVEVAAGAQIRAADSVLLVGAAVANYGNISAADGMIALVAGGEVRLARADGRVIVTADHAIAPDPERWAVVQAGTLDAGKGNVSLTAGDAYSLAINHSGITRAADIAVAGGEGGVVQVSGALDASDRSAGATGGAIAVTGDRVALLGAQLDASGDAGGGEIRVGGDLRGQGELPTAQRTYVDASSTLRADAIATGDGGTIIVWSDEATRFYGALSARGGALGGDGGFAEISGASLESRGDVDLGASAGRAGTLLYDPLRIVIQGGSADGTDTDDATDPALFLRGDSGTAGSIDIADVGTTGEPFVIFESELENTDANIALEASQSIETQGSFAGNDVVIKPGRNLTMSVVDGGAAVGTGEIVGIDVERDVEGDLLTWNLSQGGSFMLSTKSTDRDADIHVGAIVTSGTGAASDAGSVALLTERGSIEVASVQALGGAATESAPGEGGDGGEVGINAIAGSITVGEINVSGGDGFGNNRGGNGGTINIAADLDPGSTATTPTETGPRVITVNGSLLAKGGAASGGTSDTAADGGAGGQILISAGLLADEGSVALGPSGQVELNASSGSGTGDGGNPAPNATSPYSNATLGAIRIEAHDNVTAHAGITASGGSGGAGGKGGDIAIESEAGDVALAGSVTSVGGASGAAGGTVRVTAANDIAAAGGDATIRAGTIEITGKRIFSDPLDPLHNITLAAADPGSTATESATVEGKGDIRVRLDDAHRFDRFEVIQTEATGAVDIRRGDGTLIAQGTGSGSEHTITQLTTENDDPHFTYRLADGGVGDADQVDINTLAVQNVSLGARGGTLANARTDATQIEGEKLLGRIQGVVDSTPSITTDGNLQIFATNIGDTTPLSIVGGPSKPTLELDVAGDIDADVTGTIASIDLVQRRAAGDVTLDFLNGGVTNGGVTIDGRSDEDTGASLVETSVVTLVDTSLAGIRFFYHLTDDSSSSNETTSGEPVLKIARGAVDLGADAGFATTGNLELDDLTLPDEGAAIDANGHTVMLIADSNRLGTGAITASTRGTTDIADAGALIALAGSGVGSEGTPLRTSAFGSTLLLLVAGKGGSGDFRIANRVGDLEIGPTPAVSVVNAGSVSDVSYRGIHAAGDVVLENPDGVIVLADVQEGDDETVRSFAGAPSLGITEVPEGAPDLHYGFGDLRVPLSALTDATASTPTVQSGGGQSYVGPVELSANTALVAGGGVTFSRDIDSISLLRDLTVTAVGKTEFGGNVGNVSQLNLLNVTDATFTAGSHTVKALSIDFGAIEGPGSLVLLGVVPGSAIGTRSKIEIHGDVGASAALAGFDADADLLVFGTRSENGVIVTSADRIVANSVKLNNVQSTPTVSPDATIADTFGGLSIESAGEVTMGAGEKLSVTGPLAIHAGGAATLGDLAATDLSVDASQIEILGRASGDVDLPDGTSVPDRGVDWVANDIVTNVVPGWDGVKAAPTFVLGDGAIRTGGAIPFDVIRFTPDGDKIRTSSFAGPKGRTLDLVGRGTRAVAEATSDVPRAAPPVLPGLAARPGDEPPSPPRAVSSEELIGALHCRTAAGDVCAPPEVGDDPLASERAIEVRQRYRALFAGDEAQQSLRAAFAPLASVPAGDVAALSRALAHDPALGVARARIADLAVALAQVELLGLDEPESERARRSIAADFAAATGVAGLDADAVLAAVDASGVAVLP